MQTTPAAFFMLQDWWLSWFGETSAVQWIGVFLGFLFAALVGVAIYLSLLRGYLAANRSPAALRAFCFYLAVAVACVAFTLIFYGAFVYYITGTVAAITAIVAGVFYNSSKRLVAK